MKKLALILAVVLLFSLTACADAAQSGTQGSGAEGKIISQAAEELKKEWEAIYDGDSMTDTDGHFEIKNTRVIIFRENDIKEFENVAYIVEFELYTDYFGAAPYYYSADICSSVVVYEDGTMEVARHNLIEAYSAKYYSYDYTAFIEAVNDYGSEYNCTETLR